MKARLAKLKRDDKIRRIRFEQIEQEQDRVLRPSSGGALPEPIDEQPFVAPVVKPAAMDDPFNPIEAPATKPAAVDNPRKVLGALAESLRKAIFGPKKESGDKGVPVWPGGDGMMFPGPDAAEPAETIPADDPFPD